MPRCAPRCCGFCQCPMRPDCCAPRSRLPGVVYPVFQALLLRCSACFSDVLALRRLPISLLRLAPPVVASLFFVTDLFLGPARVLGCCCSGVFSLRPFQASCDSVALSCLADYLFGAGHDRPIAVAPMSFRFRTPGGGVPVSVACCVLQVLSFACYLFGCFLSSVLLRRFTRFAAPPRFPNCVTPLVCFSFAQFPVTRYAFPILRLRFSPSCIFPVILPRRASLVALLSCSLFPTAAHYPQLVMSLLSSLLPVLDVFVASPPAFAAILLRCDFPVVAPSFCFSRVSRFCCPVAFCRLRRPASSVRPLLRFRIWCSNLRSCLPSFASGCRSYRLNLRAINAVFCLRGGASAKNAP